MIDGVVLMAYSGHSSYMLRKTSQTLTTLDEMRLENENLKHTALKWEFKLISRFHKLIN